MKAVKKPENSAVERARGRRRKINPASPPTSLELHGVRIHFPFKPYACQEDYMKKVLEALLRGENALLESPTGTGKTLCLLCSALAWQREQSRLLQQQQVAQSQSMNGNTDNATQSYKPRVPTIIYASRTHSQLSQVVRELRNTRYRPLHAVLGSREQMCVHPKVKKPTSSSADINHDCNKLCKDRKCKYRNNLEGFTAPANEEGGTGNDCQPVMDMEDLLKMGTESKVCPFYYTRAQVEKAELVLVPYNYLFDKDAKETTLQGIDWKNSVVIFDEAHNLESFASESASFDLSSADIAGCLMDITRAINYIDSGQEANHNLKRENLAKLKVIFLKIEAYVDGLGNQCAYAGEYMIEIFRQGHITHANHEILIDELRKVNEYLMDMKGASRGSSHLDHFVHCLKRVFSHALESRCLAKAAFYRVYVSPKPTGTQRTGRTVSYWCFAPSLAMEELTAKSIIVTSGTLAPLKGLSMELGLKFPHTLENPHIVSEKQIHVRVVGKGVSGKTLSSSYERRQDGDYYAELGNTLVSLAKIVPAGMLVFFPSYGVMETCIERWGGPSSNRAAAGGDKASKFFAQRQRKQPSNKYVFICVPTIYFDANAPQTPWKRLTSTKSVILEPRSSADLPDAISEFQRLLALPKSRGCILMGVCRGKISEGIDFSNEQSRAVVITGLPFPPTHDPKVKMKREYLDASRAHNSMKPSGDAGFKGESSVSTSDMLSGHEWYSQQAHRAVNQAIGRVIRNRTDYGAVILLDGRFAQAQNQDGLSSWLRPHIKPDEGFGAAISGLVRFYKEADVQAKQLAKELAETKSILLEYEDDDDDEDQRFTKIAIVRRPDSEAENAPNATRSDAGSRDYVAPGDILSRVDVRDQVSHHVGVHESATNNRTTAEAMPARGTFDAVFQQKPAVSESPAAQFLRMARKVFNAEEMTTFKKASVAMTAASKKMDMPAYTGAAAQIISLINKHHHFELQGVPGEERMLLLFFKLQSNTLRACSEMLAMRLTYESSTLARLCAEHLAEAHRRSCQKDIPPLLFHIWCEDKTGSSARHQFVEKAKHVIVILLSADRNLSATLVEAFMKLMPHGTRSEAQALVNQLRAALNVEKLRNADKIQVGEVSVKSDRFKLATHALVKNEPLEAPNNSKPQPTVLDAPPLKRPLNAQYNNPYAKKKAPPSAAASTIPGGKLTLARANPQTKVSAILKHVEQSGAYVPLSGNSVSDAAKSLQKKSNASLAKDLMCPICTAVGLTEPFVADCGHIACLGCWKSWLDRSESCPTCRKPASKDTIARVVFDCRPVKSDNTAAVVRLDAVMKEQEEMQDESSDEDLEFT